MTRFLIAKQVGPDAYRTIAGLCDGYLEHTGAILLEHYSTPEKVDKLLDLGDIYYLGKELDPPPGMTFEEKQTSRNVTMAFSRDFGDPGDPAEVLSLEELDSPEFRNEYVYIFTEANQWAYFSGTYDHGLLDLRDSVNRLMEAPPPKVVAAPQHRYYDANKREIFADMHIQFPSGTVEKVYATQDADGNPDLGINASNDAYMRNHGIPEAEREFYSLSSMLHNKAVLPDVRRAAYYYALIRYSYASSVDSFGSQPHAMWRNFPLITAAAKRLQSVVIENKDCEKLINQYDRPESFFYCDPPYYETEAYYEGGGFGRDDHARLANKLCSIQGKFLLSYNDCPEIRELYDRPGIVIEATTRLSNIAQRYEAGAQYPELLIANYDTMERVRSIMQLTLFDSPDSDPHRTLNERIIINGKKHAG